VRDAVLAFRGAPYQSPDETPHPLLLVFGGSQGARFFSEALPPALGKLPGDLRARLKVVQQAREEDIEALRAAYAKAGIDAEIAPFFRDLPERIAKAQLVIARAGASTVAELTTIGRPALLVPLPHALDNDQLENATRLEQAGGGWCVKQSELTDERLARLLQDLLSSPERLAKAAEKSHAMATPDAVKRLADMVEALVKSKEQA
jgi:UDP-N-acetylglucosamine--N-acetylmuramyl-(pentapeptide) pyrophosphoryl-undecaprenol N-acetylglucosamine transferase